MAHPWPGLGPHPWAWRGPAEVAYFIDSPKATGATAGTPGTFTGGTGGVNGAAGMSGITASPATAWTTGQRVVCNDGTEWHWTGTVWAAGRA